MEPRIGRRDSDSSTDSWSVVHRSRSVASTNLSSSSISYCSSFHDRNDENEDIDQDQLSECDSDDVSTEDSDLEIEADGDEIEEGEEAKEENQEDEDQEEDGEEEEEEDDEISLVDEDEVLDNSEALQYMAAEKTSRRFDLLAKQLESPFDRVIGGERNRPFVLGSLLICSAIGLTISQMIGSTWIAKMPRSNYLHQSLSGRDLLDISSLDIGLQSRRMGRLQHLGSMERVIPVEIPKEKEGYELILNEYRVYERNPAPQSLSYGNCTRDLLRKKWAKQAVEAFFQWANNLTDNHCPLRESVKIGEIQASKSIHVVPSISSIPPDFMTGPEPSFAQLKSFRPTITRTKRPSIPRPTLKPSQSPPPPPVSWKKRHGGKTTSKSIPIHQCPRLITPSTVNPSRTKPLPPSPIEKKYRHYTKTSTGITRRSSVSNQPISAKIERPQSKVMSRANMKFSKALFNRVTKAGPIPPPKSTKMRSDGKTSTSVQHYRPCSQFKPCQSRHDPCFTDFQVINTKMNHKETSLVIRRDYSLTRSLSSKRRKTSIKKYESASVCHGHSNTSRTAINKRNKLNITKKTTSKVHGCCSSISQKSRALRRLAEPQCDRRLWNTTTRENAKKPRKLQLNHKKPVPCRENNKLDEQIRAQHRKKLRKNW